MTETAASRRSSVLDEIAEVIGEEAAMRLVKAFGGIDLYVPEKVGHAHPITVAIGAVAAARLVEHYHRTELTLPRFDDRRTRVQVLAATGRLTKKAIALEVGFTERHVYHVLKETRDEGEQPDLFGARSP